MNGRVIKFRMWDKVIKKMMPDLSCVPFDHEEYEFMQFTGLTDKTGKEIYEGDLLSWSEYQGWEDGRTFTSVWKVEWDEDDLKWIFEDIYSGDREEAGNCIFDNVIGNIFENPDMIEPPIEEMVSLLV